LSADCLIYAKPTVYCSQSWVHADRDIGRRCTSWTLAAIAIPTWQTFIEARRLNIAQDQVYRAMREAQSNATHAKLNWQVSFREVDEVVQWGSSCLSHQRTGITSIPMFASMFFRKLKWRAADQFDYRGNVSKPPFGRITIQSAWRQTQAVCVCFYDFRGNANRKRAFTSKVGQLLLYVGSGHISLLVSL